MGGVRVIASQISLRLAVALSAGSGLTLVQAARAVGVSVSSARTGLEVLVADHVALRSGHCYTLVESAIARALVAFALVSLQVEEVLKLLAAGSGVVEFVGIREDEVLIVFDRAADPLDESRAARKFEEVLEEGGRRANFMAHDDVRRSLRDDPDRRHEYLQHQPLFGNPAVIFPDVSRAGARAARASRERRTPVPKLSRRRAAAIRARYGVVSARLFGSVVRDDFGALSDVDVAIRFSRQPNFCELLELERELEEIFDCDVDIVHEDSANPQLRSAIEREGVPLLQ